MTVPFTTFSSQYKELLLFFITPIYYDQTKSLFERGEIECLILFESNRKQTINFAFCTYNEIFRKSFLYLFCNNATKLSVAKSWSHGKPTIIKPIEGQFDIRIRITQLCNWIELKTKHFIENCIISGSKCEWIKSCWIWTKFDITNIQVMI